MRETIYFRGGRKKEEIIVNGHYYELGVGGIISDILDVELGKLLDAVKPIKKLMDMSDEKLFRELGRLPTYISDLNVSPVLKDMFLCQPFQLAYLPASGKQRELEFTETERRKYFEEKGSDYQEDQLAHMLDHSAICWEVFAGFFGEKHCMPISTSEEVNRIIECARSYLENFFDMLLSVRRLHAHLREWVEEDTLGSETKNSLIYSGARIGFVPSEDVTNVFLPRHGYKYTQINTVIRINDLVALEIDLMNRNRQKFYSCELCGRYFVPFSKKSVFCHNKNPEYANKKCSVIGPALKHQDKLRNYPLYGEYARASGAYRKWSCDNRKNQSIEIVREIKSNYLTWANCAQQALEDHAMGLLSEDALKEMLKVPSIRERSPLLWKAKQEQKFE